MKVGSLFSGIGGLDLGFERAGFEIAWMCEIDPYARKVLKKHWPDVPVYEDITKLMEVPYVDVLVGGFPCQDISIAGKGAGIDGEKSGLWREYVRVIRLVRPRYVVVENVPALLNRGMGRVLGDLYESGYDAEWQIISAQAVGAPHLRERVFIVAYPTRKEPSLDDTEGKRWKVWHPTNERQTDGAQYTSRYTSESMAHASSKGLEGKQWAELQGPGTRSSNGCEDVPHSTGQQDRGVQFTRVFPDAGASGEAMAYPDREGLAVGQVFRGDAAKELTSFKRSCSTGSGIWFAEPDVGRVVDGVPSRVDRLRCLGNAVVPQVAQWVAEQILRREGLLV